jgi:preprotein translocase subunit SecD
MLELMRALAIFLLAGVAARGFSQGAPPAAVTLAVDLMVPCSGPHAGQPITVKGSSERLCLDGQPFLTEKDVESAEIHKSSSGQPVVFLTFHRNAAMRELQVTLKNVGRHIGIVLNGRLLATPTIAAGSRQLYLDGGFTQAQAEALVAAFYREARLAR